MAQGPVFYWFLFVFLLLRMLRLVPKLGECVQGHMILLNEPARGMPRGHLSAVPLKVTHTRLTGMRER